MSPRVLGDLSPARFLAEYWRKKPLLVHGAWPAFRDPLTAEELAGLACEEGVESRLVLAGEDEESEAARQGPFTDDDFLNLPDAGWTLRVADVEKHAPDLATLLEPFRFIPDWRIDGLTVCYATPPGTVGPRRNDDDRFVLQGQGRQYWQVGAWSAALNEGLAGVEFMPEHEWALEPGDLLYLPPGVVYCGSTLESALLYTVNCRAPSQRELLGGFLEFLLEGIDPDAHYADPDLAVQDNPGEITLATLDQARTWLRCSIALDDETLAVWFGRTLSASKPGFQAEPEPEPYDEDELRDHLRGGGNLERNPGSRFYYMAGVGDETLLFVDGQEFALGPEVAFMAPLLCRHRLLTPALLREALKQPDARQLLLDLVNEGYLVIYEE